MDGQPRLARRPVNNMPVPCVVGGGIKIDGVIIVVDVHCDVSSAVVLSTSGSQHRASAQT